MINRSRYLLLFAAILSLLVPGCLTMAERERIEAEELNTPEHKAKVKEVERLLQRGQGYYNLGDFDSAIHEYNRVLTLDPYNEGAKRGKSMSERAKGLSSGSLLDYPRG